MSTSVKCDDCGAEYTFGEWPYCPHGKPHFHVDAFDPVWDDNITSDGAWITSERQRQRIMDENGLVPHKNPHRGSVGEGRRQYYDQGKR